MKWIIFIIAFFLNNSLIAQNLIVNGCFEEYDICQQEVIPNDSNYNRTMAPLPFYSRGWYFPFFSSADYYNTNCPPTYGLEFIKEQIPEKSGFGCAGFNLFGPDGNFEPITGSLNDTLIEGELYEISFRMCFLKTISQWYSRKIELKLSYDLQVYPRPIYSGKNYVKLFKNTTVIADIEVDISKLSDSVYWGEFHCYYRAKGNEKYITFGMFYQNNYDLTKFSHEFAQYSSERRIKPWLRKNRNSPVLVFQGEIADFLNLSPQQKRIVYYFLDDVRINIVNEGKTSKLE